MQIFKNGKKPPFMNSEQLDLTTEKICFAFMNIKIDLAEEIAARPNYSSQIFLKGEPNESNKSQWKKWQARCI